MAPRRTESLDRMTGGYVLTVDVFEPGQRLPVVRHQFFGRNPDAVRALFAAHKTADAFLRECVEEGEFSGRIACRATQPHIARR